MNNNDLDEVNNFPTPTLPLEVWLERVAGNYGEQVAISLRDQFTTLGKSAGQELHKLLIAQGRKLGVKWGDNVETILKKALKTNIPENVILPEEMEDDYFGDALEDSGYEGISLAMSFFTQGLIPYLSSLIYVLADALDYGSLIPIADEILEKVPSTLPPEKSATPQ